MSGTTEWGVGFKKKATAWGSAAPSLAAGDLLLIESETMPDMIPEPIEDANVGDALAGGVIQGNFPSVEGTLVMPARYEGIERILALFQGDDVKSDAPGETSGSARQHSMIFQPSNTGKYGSLVVDKNVATGGPWEYRDAKPSKIQLTHNNGKLMLTPTLIPSRIDRSADQTNSSLSGITAPSSGTLALFNQLTVGILRLTGAEGNIASPTNDICVTNINFVGDRKIKGIQDSCNEGAVGEPETDGLPTADLTLSIADYTDALDQLLVEDAQIRAADREPPRYKLQLKWRGGDIAGSDSTTGEGTGGKNIYYLALEIPSAIISAVPVNAGSPGARTSFDLGLKVVTPNAVIDGSDWAWTVANSNPYRFLLFNEYDSAAD